MKFFLELKDWWVFDDGTIPVLQGSELSPACLGAGGLVEGSDDGNSGGLFPDSLAV
jgi:hypothetical protein